MSNLTTFANETRLLSVGRETLVEVDCARPSQKGKRMFVAVTRDGFRTDYPYCQFAPENRVLWSNPEWFSRRFRERVARKVSRLCRERAKV